MKTQLIKICVVCALLSCNQDRKVRMDKCCDSNSEKELKQLSDKFSASKLSFNGSIQSDTAIIRFLKDKDFKYMNKCRNYKYFVTLLLLKQYNFHITNYHQSFDILNCIESPEERRIVHDFIKIANLQAAKLEMLSSSYIKEYVVKSRLNGLPSFLKELNQVEEAENNL